MRTIETCSSHNIFKKGLDMFRFLVPAVTLIFITYSANAHHDTESVNVNANNEEAIPVNDKNIQTITDENGCKVYNPMPQQGESVSWDGNCSDGFADGTGTLKWFINGELKEYYSGQIVDGWAEGNGVYTSHDGTQYDGEWVRSRQHGRGMQVNPDGSAYDGEWSDGRPHGWGRARSPDGETFEGEWRNGEPLSESDGRRI